MASFLSTFKNRRYLSSSSVSVTDDIILKLEETDDARAILRILDTKGKEILPDYRRFHEPLSSLLRCAQSAREMSGRTISWGGATGELFLDEHPRLMRLLLKCPGVQDKDGAVISPLEGLYTLNLTLDASGDVYAPALELAPESGKALAPLHGFRLITDNYAVTETHRIVEIQPVGENYHLLKELLNPVAKEQLEMFISVALSSFDNLQVFVDGRECACEESRLSTLSTLVFEKVDAEKSLYLHAAESLPGVSIQFLEDFSPSWIVSFSPEGRLSARELSYVGTAELVKDIRKSIAEVSPSRKAAKEVYEDEGFFILPPEVAEPFLIGYLASFAKKYVLLGADKLSSFKIRKVSPRLKFSSFSGIDFLEGRGEVQWEDGSLSLSDFLSQYRQNRYVQIAGSDRLIVDPAYVERLERLVSRGGQGGKVKISFFDLPEVTSLLAEIPDSGIFRRSRAFYEGFNALARNRFRTPADLKAVLRPYQKEGVKWMKYLYDNRMGGCLADDMGLGKTVQAIALVTAVMRSVTAPILIVMPRSLLFNWRAEWERFAPEVQVSTYYGTGRDWDAVKGSRVILTTYALVRNDVEMISGTEFDTVVLDESQHIKNLSAKMSQAVLLLKTAHRFALSGTPVENHLGELYALMRFLNPPMFGAAEEFNRKYAVPIQQENNKEAMIQLRRKVSPFVLRRLKGDVLKELPDRVDQTLIVEMEPEHAAYYERRRRYYAETVRAAIRENGVQKSQFELFQALSELRRIASVPESTGDGSVHSSKIPVLAEALVEAVENGHKSVVFFNFIAGVELMGAALREAGIEYDIMTGATRDRAAVVGRFQNDLRCKVLLMTLKTGGVGLNLTAADTVFIAEPWWNRSAEDQAVGRLHRIGQKSSVHAFTLVVKDTIEEKIRLLQERKSSLIEELLQSEGRGGKILSEEDIDFILG